MVGPLKSGYQLVTSEDMVNNRVRDTRLRDNFLYLTRLSFNPNLGRWRRREDDQRRPRVVIRL